MTPPETGPARALKTHEPEDRRADDSAILLRLREVAKRLGISLAHAARLNASGRLPQAVRLGRCVRWSVIDLDAWVAAGAPSRDRWNALRRTQR